MGGQKKHKVFIKADLRVQLESPLLCWNPYNTGIKMLNAYFDSSTESISTTLDLLIFFGDPLQKLLLWKDKNNFWKGFCSMNSGLYVGKPDILSYWSNRSMTELLFMRSWKNKQSINQWKIRYFAIPGKKRWSFYEVKKYNAVCVKFEINI